MEFIVTEKAQRAARMDGTCFYCNRKIGQSHSSDCVLIQKMVKVRMMVEYEISVPASWEQHDVEFHRNESSWCADNALSELTKIKKCLCDCTKFEYIEDTSGPSLIELEESCSQKEETMEKIYIPQEVMDALDRTIYIKWYGICFRGHRDEGVESCNLRSIHFKVNGIFVCEDCPVKQYTGYGGCYKTPYDKWKACFKNNEPKITNTPKKMRAALNFYDWLIELKKRCKVKLPSDEEFHHFTGASHCPTCGRAFFSNKNGVDRDEM